MRCAALMRCLGAWTQVSVVSSLRQTPDPKEAELFGCRCHLGDMSGRDLPCSHDVLAAAPAWTLPSVAFNSIQGPSSRVLFGAGWRRDSSFGKLGWVAFAKVRPCRAIARADILPATP